MLILTIRSDKPEAEVGLFDDSTQLAYETWHAHRELSVSIHQKIETLLASQHKALHDLKGVVCFAGPGSFTGLRIGLSVGNALAYGLDVPVVATQGEDWISEGSQRLATGTPDAVAIPQYGAEAHITKPR